MRVVTATFNIGDNAAEVVAEILCQFPKGVRVKLAVSEVPQQQLVPGLEEYRTIIEKARRQAPQSPWQTTAETMQALREGEAN